jgi:hypothetical protein
LHEMEEARRSGNKILVTAPVPLVLLIAGLLLLILKYLSSNLPNVDRVTVQHGKFSTLLTVYL